MLYFGKQSDRFLNQGVHVVHIKSITNPLLNWIILTLRLFFYIHYSWMKRFQLGNISSRRNGLQQFIERQFERTRVRVKAIDLERVQKKNSKASFFGSKEVWKQKANRDRTPLYLGSKHLRKQE